VTMLVLMAVVFASASFIQGFAGFGFGIFAMALLPFVVDFKFGALVCTLVALGSLGATGWECRRQWRWRAVGPLLPGLLLSNVGGAEFFIWAKSDLLMGMLAVVVVFTGVRGLVQRENHGQAADTPIRPRWSTGLALGLVAGFLGATVNMPGPPVIVYAYARTGPSAARAFLAHLFLANLFMKITVFGVRGQWSWHILWVAAAMLPVAWLASHLGGVLHNRLPKHRLVRAANVILLLLGGMLLWMAVCPGSG
jgi:uncharacterized protein